MEPLLRLLDRLLRARSIDELISLVETSPEALSSEFFDVMSSVMSEATARGDVDLAVGIERLAHVLTAMYGAAPSGQTRLFAALVPIGPALAELAEHASWPGWARVLPENPFLYSAEFINHLAGLRDTVHAGDLWLLEALIQLLVQCHEDGVPETLPRWASTSTAGDAAFLPAELEINGLEYVAQLQAQKRDLAAAEAFSNLGKVLYQRQLGDPAENLERAQQLLRASIELAEAAGDVKLRADSQHVLVNVLLRTNEVGPDAARAASAVATAALEVATAGLEGWDHDSDPELWGLLMTSRANCLLTLGRTDEAIDVYRRSLSVFSRESAPRRWGIAMYGMGQAYLNRARKPDSGDDVDQAIVHLSQAAEVRTRDVNEARWAMTQDSLAWAHLTRRSKGSGDLQQAVVHFRNALEFHRPGSPHRAQALSGLGQALLRSSRGRDDLIEAKRVLEEALEDPGPPFPAATCRALAEVCHSLDGSDPAAVEHQQRAVELGDADAHVTDVVVLCDYLTNVYQVDGDVRALALLNELIRTASGVDKGLALHGLATMHLNNRVGDQAQNAELALTAFREALDEVTEATAPWLWAELHTRIAGLLTSRARRHDEDLPQQRAEVFRLLDIALGAATRSGHDSQVIEVRLKLVDARSRFDDEAGVEELEAIREHYRAERDVLGFARTQSALAKAYGPHDRRAIWAADTARRLLPIASDPGEAGRACERLGGAYVRQGEQERAGHAYRDAVRARGLALRLAVLPSDEHQVRASFRRNIAEQACLAFARAAEQESDPAKRRALAVLAIESLEEGRMRGFPEFETAHLDEVDRNDPVLAGTYREALTRLRACARADRAVMTGSLVGPKLLVDDSRGWIATRDEARVAAADLDRVLLAIRERTGLDLAMPPLSVPEISALLAPDEAFAYLLSDDADDGTQGHLLLLVRADGEVVFRWSTPKVDDFYQVATWLPNQSAFSSGSATKLLADALDAAFPVAGELLTGPLAEELQLAGATRVHLVPCGILGNFPFHAAPAPDLPLGEEFAVSYLPSAAVLKSLRQRAFTAGPRHVMTVANPLPNPKPLPFATIQQAAVTAAARARGIPAAELAEHAATGQAVRDAMSTATHLDFACHGRLDQGSMLESGLTLADGQLVLRDVLDSDLLAGARLVTLTSCQSGAAPGNPFDDEPMSFATGFLVAGANAVLGTLWLVDDLATALLSGRFYHHHLVDELPLPIALGRAQRWLRELTAADVAAELGEPSSDPVHELIHPFEHPLYWASFVLTCD